MFERVSSEIEGEGTGGECYAHHNATTDLTTQSESQPETDVVERRNTWFFAVNLLEYGREGRQELLWNVKGAVSLVVAKN